LPEQEARQNYNQFEQNVPPQRIEQAHQQYYEQRPQQRGNLMQGLLDSLTQQEYHPQQAGISTINPYNMSPQDAACVTSYARSKNRIFCTRLWVLVDHWGASVQNERLPVLRHWRQNKFLGVVALAV
jgi:hypothetical protein